MIKAVIFDLDNTLVDFMKMKRIAVEAAIYAMIDSGLPLTQEQAAKGIDEVYKEQGIEYQQVFDEFLTKVLGSINHKILSAGIVAYRRAREANLIPYTHVYATLNQLLKMGMKLGVLSDAPGREAWLRLAYLNFHHIFDVVLTYDETGVRKPSPVPFNMMLAKLDVKPGEAIMVGDWEERDIKGAASVGIKTAFARYGDVFQTGITTANYDLNDVSELISIIRAENGS